MFFLQEAQVAGALGVDVVMIAPGGLGVSFDQLAMNKALLEKLGVYTFLSLFKSVFHVTLHRRSLLYLNFLCFT